MKRAISGPHQLWKPFAELRSTLDGLRGYFALASEFEHDVAEAVKEETGRYLWGSPGLLDQSRHRGLTERDLCLDTAREALLERFESLLDEVEPHVAKLAERNGKAAVPRRRHGGAMPRSVPTIASGGDATKRPA